MSNLYRHIYIYVYCCSNCGGSIFAHVFCYAVLCVLSSFAIILMGKRAGCFILFVLLMFCGCYCSIALLHGAMGLSAVYDCGILNK